MQFTIARTEEELRAAVQQIRREGRSLALVPTMGSLHDGHATLMHAGAASADVVAASIFVNPAQFGPNEDFDRYPRQLEADVRVLREAGVSLLYAPESTQVYPPGFATRVSVGGVARGWEADFRPGFFDGVATVVAKLLLAFMPDVALFGEKDYQQLQVIRRMTLDLGIPVRIQGVPTVREADGLALSSRNVYLMEGERRAASALPIALREAVGALTRGEAVAEVLEQGRARLLAAGFDRVDYFGLADADTFEALGSVRRPARLLVAAWLGKTRLIDNMAVEV